MAVAPVPAPTPTSPRKATPSSILLPCSSLPKPSKDAAGERKLGWLAAPPRELTLPRPIAPVVSELQPDCIEDDDLASPEGFVRPDHHSAGGAGDDAGSIVPSLSVGSSTSRESVDTASAASANSNSGNHNHPPSPPIAAEVDAMPSFSALQRSGSISVADATRPNWERKNSSNSGGTGGGRGSVSSPRSTSTPRAGPSPAIRFGTLPERPPELRRRNSITLGVLARKNMLSAQGSNARDGGTGPGGPVNKVYMTDAEWEAYQEQFAKRTGAQPVDLGAVMSSGAKKFFGKLRRGSNTSTTSNGSSAAGAGTGSPARGRSDSAASASATNQAVSPKVSAAVSVEPALVEEDEPHSQPGTPLMSGGSLGMTTANGGGDETPRRRGSPIPVPAPVVFDDDEELNAEDAGILREAVTDTGVHPQQLVPNGVPVQSSSAPPRESDVLHQPNPSSVAALGFELDNYKGRTWDHANGHAVSS